MGGHPGGRADLGHLARFEDDKAIGEDDGVDRVVGDEQAGAVEGGEVAAQLGPHLDPGAGVQRGERLVEQQQPWAGGQRPRQGHPLRLPTRQRSRLGASVLAQAEALEPAVRLGPSRILRSSPRPQTEGDVVERGQAREQEVVLEDDADRSLRRGYEDIGVRVVQDDPVERDVARVEGLQPGDAPQGCGLASTIGPEQRDHLAVVDSQLGVEVELAQADLDVGVQHLGSGRQPAVAER